MFYRHLRYANDAKTFQQLFILFLLYMCGRRLEQK